jgi:predicted metallopeptidase
MASETKSKTPPDPSTETAPKAETVVDKDEALLVAAHTARLRRAIGKYSGYAAGVTDPSSRDKDITLHAVKTDFMPTAERFADARYSEDLAAGYAPEVARSRKEGLAKQIASEAIEMVASGATEDQRLQYAALDNPDSPVNQNITKTHDAYQAELAKLEDRGTVPTQEELALLGGLLSKYQQATTDYDKHADILNKMVGVPVVKSKTEDLKIPGDLGEAIKTRAEMITIEEHLQKIQEELAHLPHDKSGNLTMLDELTKERLEDKADLEKKLEKLDANYQGMFGQGNSEAGRKSPFEDIIDAQATEIVQSNEAQAQAERQAKIESIILNPTPKEQKEAAEQARRQQVAEDVKSLSEYTDKLKKKMGSRYQEVARELAKYAKKVDQTQLWRLSQMSYDLERKFRGHDHSALDSEEQRKGIDSILSAEDGLLLKMFIANGIDYDSLSPKKLHDIVFLADSQNTLRESRKANMGKFASFLSEVGQVFRVGGASVLGFMPVPIGNYFYGNDSGILGAENRARDNAIAHLDRAAAEKYKTLSH